jgi:hypothetical protein
MLTNLGTDLDPLLMECISIMSVPFLLNGDLVLLIVRLLVCHEKWAQERVPL